MALVLASSITVHTNTGDKVIQLLVGDITKLAKEDEVDVLVISAFPGRSVRLMVVSSSLSLLILSSSVDIIGRFIDM